MGRNAYECLYCLAEMKPRSFCPQCGHPTDFATFEERISWEVRRWRQWHPPSEAFGNGNGNGHAANGDGNGNGHAANGNGSNGHAANGNAKPARGDDRLMLVTRRRGKTTTGTKRLRPFVTGKLKRR